jgi:hypothetical protein
MRNVSVLFTAAAVVILSAPCLFAQAQGFGGSMLGGGGGGGGMGMGGGGGMSGGGGTGMGSGMGSSSTGGLSMLSASSLSGGFGVLGFGAMNGFGSSSTGGSSMYGGRSYGAVTQAGGTTGMSGGGGGGRTTNSGGSTTSSGGGGGGAAPSSSRRRGGTTNTNTAAKEQQAWFEPRVEIGFETPSPTVSAIASSVAKSLGAGNPGSRFRGVQVAFEGGTAILRGVVATPNDRVLASQIALLEPSVSAVRNDLTIAGRTGSSTVQ